MSSTVDRWDVGRGAAPRPRPGAGSDLPPVASSRPDPATEGSAVRPTRHPPPFPSTRAPNPSAAARPPHSVLVHGRSRPLVNLLLYAVAGETTPGFHWLDLRPASDPPADWDPVQLGWLDAHRSWVADPGEALAADHARANAALFELIRSDEPPEVLARLTDFLRLPATMQNILASISAGDEPSLLAVANADRVSESIPDAALEPILAAFGWLRCSLYVGYAGPELPRTEGFGTVLRIDGTSLADWSQARVRFERGGPELPTPTKDSVPVSELPFVARVFQRAVR